MSEVIVKSWFDKKPWQGRIVAKSSGDFGSTMLLVKPKDGGGSVWCDPSDCKPLSLTDRLLERAREGLYRTRIIGMIQFDIPVETELEFRRLRKEVVQEIVHTCNILAYQD